MRCEAGKWHPHILFSILGSKKTRSRCRVFRPGPKIFRLMAGVVALNHWTRALRAPLQSLPSLWLSYLRRNCMDPILSAAKTWKPQKAMGCSNYVALNEVCNFEEVCPKNVTETSNFKCLTCKSDAYGEFPISQSMVSTNLSHPLWDTPLRVIREGVSTKQYWIISCSVEAGISGTNSAQYY